MKKLLIILACVLLIIILLFIGKYYATSRLLKSIETQDMKAFEKILPLVFDIEGIAYPDWLCAASETVCKTPLQAASHSGNLEMVKSLVERGADVNGVRKYAPFSPIMLAATSTAESNLDIVEYLIQNGADVSYRKEAYDADALYQIAISQKTIPNVERIIALLRDNGGDIYYEHKTYGSLLNVAAFHGNDRVILCLLRDYSMDPNKTSSNGSTALIYYCKSSYADKMIVQDLLACGADKSIKDHLGKTAYDYAIENGYTEIAELLK